MADFIEEWAGNTSTVGMRESVIAGQSRSLSWLSCINGLPDLLKLHFVEAALSIVDSNRKSDLGHSIVFTKVTNKTKISITLN